MSYVPISEHTSLSNDEFVGAYLTPQKPVVLRGAVSAWPAVSNWSPTYIRQIGHGIKVEVLSKSDYGTAGSKRHSELVHQVDLSDVADMMTDDNAADLSYARQTSAWVQIPQMYADVGPIGLDLEIKKDEGYLWLGPPATVAQLHWDPGRNIVVQIYGEKRWILMSPADSHLAYPNKFDMRFILKECSNAELTEKVASYLRSASMERIILDKLTEDERKLLFHYLGMVNNCDVNVENPDANLTPLIFDSTLYETTLGAGDLLFVPLCWRHYVRSLSPSLSMNWFFHQERGIPQRLMNRTLLEHIKC